MKRYVHARLSEKDRALLDQLRKTTGLSESELIRRGLQLIFKERQPSRSALDLAGRSSGKFRGGPEDLSTSKDRLEGFGE